MLLRLHNYISFLVQCLTFLGANYWLKNGFVFYVFVTHPSHTCGLSASLPQYGLAIRYSVSFRQLSSWSPPPSNIHLDRLLQATYTAVSQRLPFTILIWALQRSEKVFEMWGKKLLAPKLNCKLEINKHLIKLHTIMSTSQLQLNSTECKQHSDPACTHG